MTDNEIQKLKKELMNLYWTEELHDKLEELRPEDRKIIVELMDGMDIFRKVNIREYQQDYIADYIEYLWEISETAYWKHIKISLNVEIGLLWSDNMSHFERMCNVKIPDDILETVLDFIIQWEEKNTQDLEAIGCVIKAQVDKFGRLDEIKKYISSFNNVAQAIANKRINEMLNRECPYRFD